MSASRYSGFVVSRAIEVGQLAYVMSDLEIQIPQRMQQRLDEALFRTADRASPNTTSRSMSEWRNWDLRPYPPTAQTASGARVCDAGVVDELADDAVDALGMTGQRRTPAFAALGGVDQLAPRLVERRREAEPKLRLIDVSPLSGAHRHP